MSLSGVSNGKYASVSASLSSYWSRYANVLSSHVFPDFQLEAAKYAQLPPLPAKTMPLMTPDSTAIVQRSTVLTLLLLKLCARADVRQSQPLRTFIDFDGQTSYAVTPHELSRGRTIIDARFGVVGLSNISQALVAVHTDTTSLARLGKVWSLIEADELAQLSIWTTARDAALAPPSHSEYAEPAKIGDRIFARTLPEKANAMKLTPQGHIFVGMGNGTILGFNIQNPAKPFVTIAAHGQSPVIAMDVTKDNIIVSVGLDTGLRLSSPETGLVVSGGKLTKRLEVGEVFTCISLTQNCSRVFVGTDKGRVFVFDIATGSPVYIHTLSMSSYPVRCVSVTAKALHVGFDSFVNTYDLCEKGQERSMVRKHQIHTANAVPVFSVMPVPNTEYLVVGLGDGTVAVYTGNHLVYAKYYAEDQINILHFASPDGVLWAGSDDGRIVEVIIPASMVEDARYAVQMAAELAGDSQYSCASGVENQKPLPAVRLGGSSPTAVPKKSNPECLKKSAALAENDSDDDEWRKGLFSRS